MSRDKLIKSIKVIDKSGKEIPYQNISLDKTIAKYSSTKDPVWRIYVDGTMIKRTCDYSFEYTCTSCNSTQSISSIQLLRRLKNNTERCYSCRNKEENKRNAQSLFMKTNSDISYHKKIEKCVFSLFDIRDECVKKFQNKDASYQSSYFKVHLTDIEYKTICSSLVSINNLDVKIFEYWPIYRATNQMIFTSVLYDTQKKVICRSVKPILCCMICKNTWKAKTINQFKLDFKILCKDCKLVNRTFSIRQYENLSGDKILYQSKLELRFINFCNQNNILVSNGPKIKYSFNQKERTYRVDFQVRNYLIEIKDFHIWHKKQVESGQWNAKEESVVTFCNKNNMDFIMITPNNWDEITLKLIKI